MPAWGNHEWENPTTDDLRNYKGRFVLPNSTDLARRARARAAAARTGAGSTRVACGSSPIRSPTRAARGRTGKLRRRRSSQPRRPTPRSLHCHVRPPARVFDRFPRRRDDPGRRPERARRSVLEVRPESQRALTRLRAVPADPRSHPHHGRRRWLEPRGALVLTDSRTAFRAMHLAHLRVDVSATGMRLDAVCGPPRWPTTSPAYRGRSSTRTRSA